MKKTRYHACYPRLTPEIRRGHLKKLAGQAILELALAGRPITPQLQELIDWIEETEPKVPIDEVH